MQPGLCIVRRLVLSGLMLTYAVQSRTQATAPTLCHATDYGGQDAPTTGAKGNKKQIQFKVLMAGEMLDEGVHLGITNFLASDGVGLTLIETEFASADGAQEYFEKVLARAVKVTERGEKKDSSGKIVGKKASAIVPTGKPDKPIPALLLTYGKDFYEIESGSSRHLRIMEVRLTSSN